MYIFSPKLQFARVSELLISKCDLLISRMHFDTLEIIVVSRLSGKVSKLIIGAIFTVSLVQYYDTLYALAKLSVLIAVIKRS